MPTNDYKQRYLDVSSKLARQEKQLNEKIQLFTELAFTLSEIANIGDENLNKRLKTLQGLFRKGNVAKADLITLSNALKADAKKQLALNNQRSQMMQEVFQALTQHLKQQKLDGNAKQELKNFSRIVKKPIQLAYAPALLKSYSKVYFHAFTDVQQNQSGNFIDRLLKRGEEAEVDVLPSTTVAVPMNEMSVPANGVPVESDNEPLFNAVASQLQSLLDQIDPPHHTQEHYQQIANYIAVGITSDNLAAVIEHLCFLVVAGFEQLQTEFQQFLEQLNSRLNEIDRLTVESIKDQQQSFTSHRALQADVRQQMRDLTATMAEENSDLSRLKTEVQGRVDKVLTSLDKHQSDEQQREEQLLQKMALMQEKVAYMELQAEETEQQLAEQRQLALVDALTQLPNRAAYEQRLTLEYDRWRRYQSPLTMVVGDIDWFKKINDTYGHQAGDKVLKVIAKTIQKRLRKTDFIARYGGEEFVMLLPETTIEKALPVIEKIREVIAQAPFKFNDQPVDITISFGLAGFQDAQTADQVFERADQALYKAKQQGRNCCVVN